jgi:hypothetical protein
MKKERRSASNEGIQANVVNADVLAVGRGAHAIKMVLAEADRKQILEAVGQIHQELEHLNLSKPEVDVLKGHAEDLKQTVIKEDANPKEVEGALGKFIERLKQVGVVVKETAGLVAPIHTIASLLHLSLTSLGLL